ncbi:MAG: hypothetical protein SO006_08505 [Muribaculaceae bacterium]|nr:hypothetical protein [Muribaculaceae bacterium]
MADNYLERKMEEYRSGKSKPAVRRRLTPSGQKSGQITLPYPDVRVFVIGPDEKLIRAFADAGAHVSFCCDDTERHKTLRLLAEQTGARFYPLPVDEIPDRNDADYLIERHDDTILITVPASGQERRLTASGPSAPLLAVLLCGPLATLSTAIVS